MKSYLRYQYSVARSLAFPAFTTGQFVFLFAMVAASIIIAVTFRNDGARYFSVALIFSSMSALSISAPAFLIMDRRHSRALETLLERGGWRRDGSEGSWTRAGSRFSKWKNDRVCVADEGAITLVFGPYYTLKALKNTAGD